MVTWFGQRIEGESGASDNQGAVQLSRNRVFLKRTKHIDIKLHFIQDLVNEGQVAVKKMSTEENPSGMITK